MYAAGKYSSLVDIIYIYVSDNEATVYVKLQNLTFYLYDTAHLDEP